MGIADPEAIEKEAHRLISRRDELLRSLQLLKRKYEKGEVSEEEYQRKRREIERELVEIMDRLVQLQYFVEPSKLYGGG